MIKTDFNKDGLEEIIIETSGYHVLLEPSSGGVLGELDYLSRPINLSDTLTRRKEAYHSRLLAALIPDNSKGRSPVFMTWYG